MRQEGAFKRERALAYSLAQKVQTRLYNFLLNVLLAYNAKAMRGLFLLSSGKPFKMLTRGLIYQWHPTKMSSTKIVGAGAG